MDQAEYQTTYASSAASIEVQLRKLMVLVGT